MLKKHYILLTEQVATKKEKSLLSGSKTEATHVLEGSLWYSDGQKESHTLSSISCATTKSKTELTLLSLDFDNTKLCCSHSDVGELKEEEYQLLCALNSFCDRVAIFKDKTWWSEATNIYLDARVWVVGKGSLKEDKMLGRVRFRGNLPNMKGIWFGVELSVEHQGEGSTDGTHRKKRYFVCAENTGLFVHVGRLRLSHEAGKFADTYSTNPWKNTSPVQYPEDDFPSPPADLRTHTLPTQPSLPPLDLGERVVWISEQGGTEGGVVKWIGYLPDAKSKEWTVGVEFDKPVGTGTGKYKEHQLFRARQNHASLVPILGLLKEEQLYGSAHPVSEHSRTKARLAPSGRKEQNRHIDDYGYPEDLVRQYEEDYSRGTSTTKASKITSPVGAAMHHSHLTRGPPLAGKQSRAANEKSIYDNHPVYENMASDGEEQFQRPSQITSGNSMEAIYGDVHFPGRPGDDKKNSPEHAYEAFELADPSTGRPILTPRSPIDQSSSSTSGRHKPRPAGNHKTEDDYYNMYNEYGGWVQDHSGQVTSQRQIPVVGPPPPRIEADSPMSPGATSHRRQFTEPIISARPKQQGGEANRSRTEPIPIPPQRLDPSELNTDFEVGSLVEVVQNPPECRYGVIRWLGYLTDKSKPFVGLEMEEESASCTDGTFGKFRLFECLPKKGYFTYMSKIRKDGRFDESLRYTERRDSQAFGSLDCPDVPGVVCPQFSDTQGMAWFTGKGRGVQGHHNSCYMDSTLFSMFAFSMAFDTILHRRRAKGDIERYEEVQRVLRDGIVNPLRKEFYVRADKVLRLRGLLDELSSVRGMMTEEKDPEEFFNCLLQQIMKAEPFIKLSSGQMSHYYQLFVEKDERILLPTTQQLLELSFLQSDIKLAEVPSCLILQMPRFGKDFKVYKRIVPSPNLDITDILESGPRECTICGSLASHECKDCYRHFGESLDKIAFCENCLKKSHGHSKRAHHRHRPIPVNEEYQEYLRELQADGKSTPVIQREILELFAVICIETSHYVSFVKCGSGDEAPWVFFDSMADRMGEQNGYNIPEVKACEDLPQWLLTENHPRILNIRDDRELPHQMKRLLCDSYICFYQSPKLVDYK